jgi:A/G-specific adenine glycosylase
MSASDSFSQDLLRWHRSHGRHDLPWQQTPPDPYRVWLSEIMLQQTQVATVIPYFQRFLLAYPDLKALAGADEQDVLRLWSRLGYYARARNLLSCAREVMSQHQGEFPRQAKDLARLPGIGPSTAAAIAATVYQERAAILDGNVQRVLARLTCAEAVWGSSDLRHRLQEEATARLPQNADQMPADTLAIMDLGALVCRIRQPSCGQCPVRRHCLAHQHGQAEAFPIPRPSKTMPVRQAYWCLVKNSQGVWLVKRPSRGLWGGLWTPWEIDPHSVPEHWGRQFGAPLQVISLRHRFTHFQLDISAGIFQFDRLPSIANDHLVFFAWSQALHQPLPTPVHRLLLRLAPAGTASGDESHR